MPGVDHHSRLVGWLKLVLPLAALALLSTLFLVADRIDPEAALRYAEVDVEALVRDPRMTAPAYAGTTNDGTSITLSAKAARPAQDNRTATAEDVIARLTMPAGGTAELTAELADLDSALGLLRLSGGVKIHSSAGYEITAPNVVTALNRSLTEAAGPVVAQGPMGRIDAQSFAMRPALAGERSIVAAPKPPQPPGSGDAGASSDAQTPASLGEKADTGATGAAGAGAQPYLLVFSGGVKLVYHPGG